MSTSGQSRKRTQSARQVLSNENRADSAAKTQANKDKRQRAATKKKQRSSNDAQADALRDSTNAGTSALSAEQQIALLTARLSSAEERNQTLSDKNRKLKRLARPQTTSTDEEIVPIKKPKGKFNLQEAMGLSDNRQLFTELQAAVHSIALEAKIDFGLNWSQQDPGTVAKILRVAGERHTHLTAKRYPRNWATAAMLQRYINSVRAYRAGKANPSSGVSRRRKRVTKVGRLEAERERNYRSSRRVVVSPPAEDNNEMDVDRPLNNNQDSGPASLFADDDVPRDLSDDSEREDNELERPDEPGSVGNNSSDEGDNQLPVADD
ncbi:hypothetical protein B0H16DRAFT_1602374 [Mycena metata]|uniref:Uncharacterized protein n=1 Tax=Mycena metata TaxID=1033252 RepID=A0AAD7HIQ1_9AGAR|nr:hypothetical protein B0H16DRAFT_1602374 [Mycena metata]